MLLWHSCPTYAELPALRLYKFQPIGATTGSSVEIEVGGRDLEDAKELRFEHPGIKAEWVKENRFRVQVASDVPEGTYDARLVGRFGVSNPRLFAVHRGFVDFTEQEPNNTPDKAQTITVNTAINAVADSNGQDLIRIALKEGQRIALDCQAEKLDSELDGVLTVTMADGRIVASNSDYFGRDPFVSLVAPADGDYYIMLNDLSYRGGFPYRLLVTDRPVVENVFPRVVQSGKPIELTALGHGFGSAGQSVTIDGRPWEVFRFPFTAAAEIAERGGYRFLEHPTDHTVAPTAASCTLVGQQVTVPVGSGALRPQIVMVANSSVTVETEPNNAPERGQPLTVPAVVSGRFDQPRDADWFTFTAAETGPYAFEVYCERIAGRADPYVVIYDDKGERIVEFDDFGHRIQAFDGHLRDPVGTANLQKDKKYRVLVQDRYSRGGARFQYVLAVRRPTPDFFIAAIHRENQEPSGLTVWRGGAMQLDLVVHYQDNSPGPITVTGEGLPPGVTVEPTTINGDTRGTLVVRAEPNAAEFTGPIKLVATCVHEGRTLRHEVRVHTKVWNNQNAPSCRATRELWLAVRDSAPFALTFEPATLKVEQGTKAAVKVKVARRWNDFKSSIRLQGQSLTSGIKLNDLELPGGKDEVTVSLDFTGARVGPVSVILTGQAQVPYDKDPQAKNRPNNLVTLPTSPLQVEVLPKPGK
ncbi:MAG: hypothetical protein JNM18_15605 [Planctomycetaceae bacterium]|nr:hypothetical protein [Planctomycetaceae bacterium]